MSSRVCFIRDQRGLAAAVLAMASMVAPAARAADDIFCAQYGATALAQQRQQMQHGCGLQPPVWSSNLDHHVSWCANASQAAAEAGTRQRVAELKNCLKGAAPAFGENADCARYGTTAVGQNSENLRMGCGLTGPAWNDDPMYHYAWCVRVPQAHASAGTEDRRKALATCGDAKSTAMDVTITLTEIHVHDEADGSGNAESYLWPIYFKIDKQIFSLEGIRNRTLWSYAPGGNHGNLGPGYDAGQTRSIPPDIGRWETTLEPLLGSLGKDAILVGAVIVLLEEDDIPSSASVRDEHYPTFRNIVLDKIQCAFLQKFDEEVKDMEARNDPTAAFAAVLFDRLSGESKRQGVTCAPPSGEAPSGFAALMSKAEQDLQNTLIDKLDDPWYTEILGIAPFANIDDFIGVEIRFWNWNGLVLDPVQTFSANWNDATGSEDGDFQLFGEIAVRVR